MKHSDKKKLAAMACAGMLSVSGFAACAYGPEPTENLKQDYALELTQTADTSDDDTAAIPEAEQIINQ